MISIIFLFFLTRSIGLLAREYDESPFKWKLRAVLGWLLGDLLGELIIIHFFGLNILLLAIFGTGMGYLGYLFVRQWLEQSSE